jgi:flagellin-like hook-associated protein FlgL
MTQNSGLFHLDLFISNNLDNNSAAFRCINRDGIAPLLNFSLASKAAALQATSLLDNKFAQRGVPQGVVGAFQSRLSSAVTTLSSQADNYAAAEGRIRDADVAQEVASLTRLNIVRDAVASILAQANQQPQLALLSLANDSA